jgi:UDP:flavonoid glycosyltransferase YjiC (YdhE family)
MRILFAGIPAYGHLYPMLPLVHAFADAGHDVTVATGEPFTETLPFPTISTFQRGLDLDEHVTETQRRHPGAEGLELTVALFADTTADRVSASLIDQIADAPPDLVIFEAMDVGAGIAAAVLGIPAAAFSIALSHYLPAQIHDASIGYLRRVWTDRGLTPPAGGHALSRVLIDPSPPTLNPVLPAAPLRQLPLRTVAYNAADAAVPDWLMAAGTRPRIYLTLGTVSFGAVEVLQRALDDLGPLDVDILVAVGPDGNPELLGELPPNVHVERFVAQSAVFPRVDLAVHHGGTGTVLGALAAGLPQLLLPQGADQFFNGEVLTAAGAGAVLPNDAQRPGAIAAAVQRLLDPDATEPAMARRIQAEIDAMPAPAELVPQLLEMVPGDI